MKNNILMSVLLTVSLSATLPLSAASHVDVVKMRTENRVNPLRAEEYFDIPIRKKSGAK